MLRSLRRWFPPTLQGAEHLDPERPALFVGNHTTYGMIDIPLMQAEIYNASGIWLRGMTDHLHYRLPPWARFLERQGAFRGTRELCHQAMERGDNILLFPGGGREVMKRQGEEYTLIWKQRLGFVRLASQHGYPIQPFASVGADDVWDILWDAGHWQRGRLKPLLKRLPLWDLAKQGEEIPPLVRGIGLSAVPRPEPFYFLLGEPISTESYQGLENDDDAMMALRDQIAEAVRGLIEEGQQLRDGAAKGSMLRRLLNKS
tara:strand:+ start:1560 stop:2336 length:777 start_codon:yes stop_codon:yes gene_type:complete